MNILYIVTQGEMGGAQKYVLDLAQRVPGSAIAAGSESGNLVERAGSLGIPAYSVRHLRRAINPMADLRAAFEIRRLVKRLQPDIVHLNSSKAGVVGSFACIGLQAKVVFTAHGFVFNEPLPHGLKMLYRWAEQASSWFRDAIISVSEKDRQTALDYGIIPGGKITTIHNGIPAIGFLSAEDARQALGIPSEKIVLGTIANFYRTKGLDVLINAISLLSPAILRDIHFMIIGEGRDFRNLKLEIGNLGIGPYVSLPGSIPEAARYLKAFDVFILPSRKEGFSYTLLEAMQAGLPIIATDVGGNREALGNAGILVPPEDPASLRTAMGELMHNTAARVALAEQAYARSGEFTIEKMVEKTIRLYDTILKNV